MRRHKAVARIFLCLSIVNFTFAGLAQAPEMHETSVDLVMRVEDVMEVSERGYTQSEELPDWLGRPSTAGHLDSRDIIGPTSFNKGPGDPAEDKKFFNKELTRKMKEYLVLGAIAGVFTGIANGAQKEIFGTVSPHAYVFTLSSLPPILPIFEWRRVTEYVSDYGMSQSNNRSRR